jgi:hypothetical protein
VLCFKALVEHLWRTGPNCRSSGMSRDITEVDAPKQLSWHGIIVWSKRRCHDVGPRKVSATCTLVVLSLWAGGG